jgi:hypothetical protein
MSGLEPLVPVALFLSVATVLIFRGPLGKALANRLGGRSRVVRDGDHTELLEQQLEDVQHRLHDLEERLDFAEGMVARGRDRPQIQGDG